MNIAFRTHEGINPKLKEGLESSRHGVSKALDRNLGMTVLGPSELNVSRVTFADGGEDAGFCEVILSGISVKKGRRFEGAVGDLETFCGALIKGHLGEGERLELRVVIQVDVTLVISTGFPFTLSILVV